MADREHYDPPERVYLQPMPNLAEPLKGGAFLIVHQDGETKRYAFNTTSLLRLAHGITTVLVANLTVSARAAGNDAGSAITEAEIQAFRASLEDDAIDHKEEGPE